MKVFGLTLLVVAVFLSESKAAEMNEYQMVSLNNGAYNVLWKYDMLKDTFMFNVTVNATGWVAFGVSKSFGQMNGYDVIIGSVGGMHMNESYSKDYFTRMRAMPMPDAENMQNIMLTSASEMDGYTNLVFHRQRKTGDTVTDVEIMPGKMYLVWAYHYTRDINTTTGVFMRHSTTTRGGMEYMFIDEKYTIVEINDKYRLYWAYDSSKEMFYFTVVVQTTGWVAFGVSTQRGGMNGYDVIVGDSTGKFSDYLTRGTTRPPKDTIQNVNLTKYEQRDGYTLLTFHRKRNTGDESEDVEITPGKMNIVWAYGTADVPANGNFAQHSPQARGGMEYTFIEDTNGGNGSSSVYTPSILGIIALFLFQRVIDA